ncbi:hypothetical protein [Halobacillus sp. B29]|uniref:hypothetical protein n=1 Tax=Halobacillus sp. B29 TaxID=3457432 RepID=UPI003FCE7A57
MLLVRHIVVSCDDNLKMCMNTSAHLNLDGGANYGAAEGLNAGAAKGVTVGPTKGVGALFKRKEKRRNKIM